MRLSFRWSGEEHVVALLGETLDVPTAVRVVEANQRLRHSELAPLIIETVPTWCSILIHYDAQQVAPHDFLRALKGFFTDLGESETVRLNSRLVTLPVLYGGKFGPDLEFVAAKNEVTVAEARRQLAEGTHFVGMISFTPGQPNCMWLEPQLALTAPKYETPRTYTPEGTVGLGGSSIALYSVPSPGGFQMVGRLPVPIYSPYPVLRSFEGSPVLLRVGDRLRLRSVERDEYDSVNQNVREGRYQFEIEEGELNLELSPPINEA